MTESSESELRSEEWILEAVTTWIKLVIEGCRSCSDIACLHDWRKSVLNREETRGASSGMQAKVAMLLEKVYAKAAEIGLAERFRAAQQHLDPVLHLIFDLQEQRLQHENAIKAGVSRIELPRIQPHYPRSMSSSRAKHRTLCRSLRQLSVRTWRDLGDAHRHHINLKEESITDYLMLCLSRRHSRQIRVVMANRHIESKTGADFEWWLRDSNQYVCLLVQAKRMSIPQIGYRGLDHRVGGNGPFQIDLLREHARQMCESRIPCVPMYLFYNHWQGTCHHAQWDVPHINRPLYFGCTFGHAHQIHSSISEFTDLCAIANVCVPWWQLFCDDTGQSMRMNEVLTQLRSLDSDWELGEPAGREMLPRPVVGLFEQPLGDDLAMASSIEYMEAKGLRGLITLRLGDE